MKKYIDIMIPAIVIGILIILFALLIGGKVHADSVEEARREQREKLESVYIKEIKDELTKAGFSNCGVNMTKETNAEGEWEYTVKVYHRSFAWMEATDSFELESKLEAVGRNSLGEISLDLLAR